MNAINTDKKVQLTYGGLKSSTDTSGADYTIIGIPFDIRTTYRPGTRSVSYTHLTLPTIA